MTTFVYDSAATKLLAGVLNWPALPISAALLNAGYTASTSHLYLSSVPSAAFIARDVALTNLSISSDNRFRGVVPQFNALASAFPITAFILYNNTGNDATSDLIFYSADSRGFPLAPAGLNWQFAYDQAYGGFFQI